MVHSSGEHPAAGAPSPRAPMKGAARPLRFCMITTFYPPWNFGGDGLFVQRLSNELAERGHRVDVIHCRDAYRILGGKEPATAAGGHPGVTVHGLKSPCGPLSPLATHQTGAPLFKTRRIKEILEQPFDVIHFHNISLVGGPKVLALGRGIKLYTMHEYWLVCPTHLLLEFGRRPCLRRRCLPCILAHKRPPQWWRRLGLIEKATGYVDAFIAPSRFHEQMHRQHGFDAPMVCLPNFVPRPRELAAVHSQPESAREGAEMLMLPESVRESKGIPDGKPYFLYAGRLEKAKGPQTLIPVFRRYGKARLLIAGVGGSERRLRRLAGDSPYIRFLGFVSGQRLHELYRGAVAVIVPSICLESFSLTTIEALSHGIPVLARNLGGLPKLIRESGAGFTYDTDQQLMAAMDSLLVDPTLRDRLGRRGLHAYERKWTAERHLERYLELIRNLMTARRTR